jgi:hypothetical protein
MYHYAPTYHTQEEEIHTYQLNCYIFIFTAKGGTIHHKIYYVCPEMKTLTDNDENSSKKYNDE